MPFADGLVSGPRMHATCLSFCAFRAKDFRPQTTSEFAQLFQTSKELRQALRDAQEGPRSVCIGWAFWYMPCL